MHDTFKAGMAMSLLQGLHDFPYRLHLSIQRGPYLESNRAAIMQAALEIGAEKVLFIDTDMLFAADAMHQILAHDKAIIGAAYNEKRLPLVSTVKISDGNGGFATVTTNLPTDPFPCAAVGTGFLALHLPTIRDRMTPPYFEYDRQSRGRMGEDVYFAQKAHAAGLQVWCDPSIAIRHIGDYAY